MPVSFNNGFEEGDYSAWDATIGPPTIDNIITHSGIYSSKSDVILGGIQTCIKDFTPLDILHTRLYVRWQNLTGGGGRKNRFLLLRNVGVGDLFDVRQWTGGGISTIWIEGAGLPAPFWAVLINANLFAIDQWYCIEIRYVNDVVNGEIRLWLDGVEQSFCDNLFNPIILTGVNTTQQIDRIDVGIIGNDEAQIGWIDNIALADTYIGTQKHVSIISPSHAGL